MSDDTLPGTRVGDPADDCRRCRSRRLPVDPDREPTALATPVRPSRTRRCTDGAGAAAEKHKGFFRRHKFLVAIAIVLALVAGTAGGYYWWLNHELSSIARVPIGGVVTDKAITEHESSHPLNILLLGADAGHDTESVSQDLKDGKWTPFVHRSDTIMIAHIPADRQSVQLVSIPRDTWVPIKGYPYDTGTARSTPPSPTAARPLRWTPSRSSPA